MRVNPLIVRGLALTFLAWLAASGPAGAQTLNGAADLNLSPKRLVFSGSTRSAQVYVFNRGTATASYTIELVDRVMLPDGQIAKPSEAAPGEATDAAVKRLKSAREMVTFTPRRVTLKPGESQVVRVRVLTPAGLAAGEYRTHLTVSTLPPEDVGVTADQAAQAQEGQLAFRVVSLLALSIPIIVRQDVEAGGADLKDLSVNRHPDHAADQPAADVGLKLGRSGAGSVYGNLEVTAQKGGGKPEAIGAIRGIAVYPEVDQRVVNIPLQREPQRGEKLTVRFSEEDDAGKGKTLANAELNVP